MDYVTIIFAGAFGAFGGGLGVLAAFLFKNRPRRGGGTAVLVVFGLFAGVGLGVVVSGLMKPIVEENIEPWFEKERINAEIVFAATVANLNLPQMADKVTRIDKVIPGDLKITYVYSLVEVEKPELDLVMFEGTIRARLTNVACTNKEYLFFLAKDVTVEFTYLDRNGVEIAAIAVTPEDCQAFSSGDLPASSPAVDGL